MIGTSRKVVEKRPKDLYLPSVPSVIETIYVSNAVTKIVKHKKF